MKIRYLRDECYESLCDNVKNNYTKYCQKESWIEDYFGNDNYFNESSIEVLDVKLFNDGKKDFNNAILLYESLKNLTPFQAINTKLWTYLTHVTFYDYMVQRWNIDDKEMTDKTLSRIKERYLCTNSRRGLLRNGISRLWWATYLSYDPNAKDHYMYTKILFSEEELFTGLLEREISMCKPLVLGVLKCLKEYIDLFDKLPNRDLRRDLMKYLNFQAAIIMYDILDENEIYQIVKDYIKKHDKENGEKYE